MVPYPCGDASVCGLPGEMHRLLISYAQVEAGGVLHFVCVARLFDPVAQGVAVHAIDQVRSIIHTASVMLGAGAFKKKKEHAKVNY